jgi:hypothetical protein
MAAADAANEARLAKLASNTVAINAALAKLTSGSVLTDAERKLLGMAPVSTPAQTPPPASWVKAKTVQTANGPVDVDANGKAQDGSIPIAVSKPITPVPSTDLSGSDTAVANILKSYGLEGVAGTIAQIRKENPEISSDDLLTLLKTDPRYNTAYLTRFAGNAELIKKGLPTLSDRDYLKAEKEYEKIFKAYDVTGLANRGMYAKLIGNSMDAVDVTSRLQIGYDRLKADPNAEKAFRQFYPSLSNGDIVAAMLNPEEMLPALQRKAAAAEIGGSALAQGLEASQASAESLAAFGINKAGAQAGYRYIAQALPRGQFLAEIAPEENVKYTQGLAEDITFRKNVEAEKKQAAIVNKELGRFGGESGTSGSRAFGAPTKGAI